MGWNTKLTPLSTQLFWTNAIGQIDDIYNTWFYKRSFYISIYCWLYSLFLMVNRPYSFLDLLVYIPIQTCKIPYCMIEPYYNY